MQITFKAYIIYTIHIIVNISILFLNFEYSEI